MLKCGPLRDEYELYEAHFHWGEDDCRGSEHTINDTWYCAFTCIMYYTHGNTIHPIMYRLLALLNLPQVLHGGSRRPLEPQVPRLRRVPQARRRPLHTGLFVSGEHEHEHEPTLILSHCTFSNSADSELAFQVTDATDLQSYRQCALFDRVAQHLGAVREAGSRIDVAPSETLTHCHAEE